jgi:guanylate kinase
MYRDELHFLTVTGRPGSGKDTVVRLILKTNPKFVMLQSVTTRPPRSDDRDGEYKHIPVEVFKRLRDEDQFVWSFEHGGNLYGTLKSSLEDALTSSKISILILVPQAVIKLWEYVDRSKCLSFYIKSPSHNLLFRRIVERGESRESALRRIQQTVSWEGDCLLTDGFEFVDSPEEEIPGQTAARNILRLAARYGAFK